MTPEASRGDLVVLAADKNIEYAVRGLIARPRALGIRPITSTIYVHPERDPGCLKGAHQFLAASVGLFDHALVLFDRDGCGHEDVSRALLESEVAQRLARTGWDERAEVIVLDPELEIWVWSDSPQVPTILGFTAGWAQLEAWLEERGLGLQPTNRKPQQPKEAMEAVLRQARKARSSALYGQLAKDVGLNRCTDPAFQKFRHTLQTWFSP